jgi:hypothetical protein
MKPAMFLSVCVLLLLFLAPNAIGTCKTCLNVGGSFACLEVAQGFLLCLSHGESCELLYTCPSGYGCFLSGTIVDTPEGGIPIEDIEIGDIVVGWDEEAGKLTDSRVLQIFGSVQLSYVVINGSIKVTDDHPFRLAGRWVTAAELQPDDELIDIDGNPIVVTQIERVDRGVRVYNIEVDGTHTFYANGVLVHNKIPTPQG